MTANLRIGFGYDAHPLVPGRRLVLGGLEILFDKGLEGWSDADCLSHAVIEALLGAAGLGSIGVHYPPGDPRLKGISSLSLLFKTVQQLSRGHWRIVNVDCTVVAAEPKLQDHFEAMRQKLGEALGIGPSRVNVKASTSNGLGFGGRGDGIAAYAVALIEGGENEDI